jgi:hypothetical protein
MQMLGNDKAVIVIRGRVYGHHPEAVVTNDNPSQLEAERKGADGFFLP